MGLWLKETGPFSTFSNEAYCLKCTGYPSGIEKEYTDRYYDYIDGPMTKCADNYTE
jgi:hypothetical protein